MCLRPPLVALSVPSPRELSELVPAIEASHPCSGDSIAIIWAALIKLDKTERLSHSPCLLFMAPITAPHRPIIPQPLARASRLRECEALQCERIRYCRC